MKKSEATVNVTVDLSEFQEQQPSRALVPRTVRPRAEPVRLPVGVNTKKWKQTSADLCRLAYDSSPWWRRRRWMALLLTSIGVAPQEVAKLVGVSRSSIDSWRRAYEVVGPRGIDDRCKPGGKSWNCDTYTPPIMLPGKTQPRQLCSQRPSSVTTSVEFDEDYPVVARSVKTSVLFGRSNPYSVS